MRAHLSAVWVRNPDACIRCLERVNVPYKGLKMVLISEALFPNCSVASSNTVVS